MALKELSSKTELDNFIHTAAQTTSSLPANTVVCVTFSAHWCGPCRQSKPLLEELAVKMVSKVPMGIVYEETLGDAIQAYNIRAFPTHVVFLEGNEFKRAEGANIDAVEKLIGTVVFIAAAKAAGQNMRDMMEGEGMGTESGMGAFSGAGETLASDAEKPRSPEELRMLRLQKMSKGGGAAAANNASSSEKPAASAPSASSEPAPDATATSEATPEVIMTDAEGATNAPPAAAAAEASISDPDADSAMSEALTTLTGAMGFSEIRAKKGLKHGNGTVEGAVEWIMQHQEDDNIDDPMDTTDDGDKTPSAVKDVMDGDKPMSYKCNECGKILSNMANLELHANKTGHSDFEESTLLVKPLSDEEKADKINQIKDLLKAKRAEREEQEKVDHTEREKQRRMMGKEMSKTREQMEMEARKREADVRRREKAAFQKERARLKAELAKDKAERMANRGKLSTKLGVDGYNPDGIQYDVPAQEVAAPEPSAADAAGSAAVSPAKKKPKGDVNKIDEYISKVSSYKAGGDGGKCLKILKAYVGNVADNPTEEKFKTINTENKAFKTKVRPFVGAKLLLIAVGFHEAENGESLVLKEDPDYELLKKTKEKIEAAVVKYG